MVGDVETLTQRTTVNAEAKLYLQAKVRRIFCASPLESKTALPSAASDQYPTLRLRQVSETRSPNCSAEMLPFLA
jgi:hypothetical protein